MSDKRYQVTAESEYLLRKLVDMLDGFYEERVVAIPPYDLLTDGGTGSYRRLRVDVGQTGFFAGREFRTIHEFSIATGASEVIKVVAPCNTIVQMFAAELQTAKLRVELLFGGTESGTFSNALSIFKTNTMSTSSNYVRQVSMMTGGTHIGGTLVDLLLLKSGDGTSESKDVLTTATEALPVGFPAGTYYIRLINTDGATATGVFRARWEERP